MADETPLSDEERAQLVAYLDGEADEATQRELGAGFTGQGHGSSDPW